MAGVVYGKDALFVTDSQKTPRVSVKGSELVMRVSLRKIAVPKAKRAILFASAGSSTGAYTIQVDLHAVPEEGWMPVIVLGDAVLVNGVSVTRSEQMGATLSFGTDDSRKASDFLTRIAKVFGLSKEDIIDARSQKVGQAVPAHGSHSVRSGTNGTPSAAGSSR